MCGVINVIIYEKMDRDPSWSDLKRANWRFSWSTGVDAMVASGCYVPPGGKGRRAGGVANIDYFIGEAAAFAKFSLTAKKTPAAAMPSAVGSPMAAPAVANAVAATPSAQKNRPRRNMLVEVQRHGEWRVARVLRDVPSGKRVQLEDDQSHFVIPTAELEARIRTPAQEASSASLPSLSSSYLSSSSSPRTRGRKRPSAETGVPRKKKRRRKSGLASSSARLVMSEDHDDGDIDYAATSISSITCARKTTSADDATTGTSIASSSNFTISTTTTNITAPPLLSNIAAPLPPPTVGTMPTEPPPLPLGAPVDMLALSYEDPVAVKAAIGHYLMSPGDQPSLIGDFATMQSSTSSSSSLSSSLSSSSLSTSTSSASSSESLSSDFGTSRQQRRAAASASASTSTSSSAAPTARASLMPTSLSAKIPKLRLRPKEPEIRLDLTGHLTGVGACRVALRRVPAYGGFSEIATGDPVEAYVGAVQLSKTAAAAARGGGITLFHLRAEWVSEKNIRFTMKELFEAKEVGEDSDETSLSLSSSSSSSSSSSLVSEAPPLRLRQTNQRRGLGMGLDGQTVNIDRMFIEVALRRRGCGTRALVATTAWMLLTAPEVRRWRVGAPTAKGSKFYKAVGRVF